MKLKVFQSIQRNFAILGVGLHQSKQSYPFDVRNVLVLFIFGLSLISASVSVAHAHKFKEYINTFHIAVTVAFGGITFVIVMCQMKKLFQFIDIIEDEVEKREFSMETNSVTAVTLELILFQDGENPVSEAIFADANQKVEKWTKLINEVIGKAAPMWILLPKFIYSFYIYFKTGTRAFGLPFDMWLAFETIKNTKKPMLSCDLYVIQRFPFGINNPVGYVIAFTLQYVVFACMFINVSCFGSTGIGCWKFAIAYTEDIRNILTEIDDIAQDAEYQIKLDQKLSEFIVQHSLGKQLSAFTIHCSFETLSFRFF